MEFLHQVGFVVIGFVVWGLIVASIVLFVSGLLNRSWKHLLYSGLAFLTPAIILSSQQGWYLLFLLVPVAAFVLSFFTRTPKKPA
ncbi:hypothetical protein [Bacillus marinisedimentorum]|uniref:hypothetical protein n=1 Tax=Bacillus marinisedimentorum TaxID=1821260 RepID=UPI0008730DE4|nr:hypothetical protein [Bacillus marinisedimentorum]